MFLQYDEKDAAFYGAVFRGDVDLSCAVSDRDDSHTEAGEPAAQCGRRQRGGSTVSSEQLEDMLTMFNEMDIEVVDEEEGTS